MILAVFRATACRSYDTSMHDVSLSSVSVSVKFLDCYITQPGNAISAYDRISRCIGHLHADADQDCSILWSRFLLGKITGWWKRWSFAIGRHPTARMSRYLTSIAELHVHIYSKAVIQRGPFKNWHKFPFISLYIKSFCSFCSAQLLKFLFRKTCFCY